ncbi:acyltransferase family protein [Halotalea alkalilenta]|uniref:Acyltransferase n=1 Tax=Halotalea alkalilenta TaxID=376489 RepID=A0A172YJ40_9GAMM|nr:acyltransferase [Halotalea alkalilenta]ANF59182.1 acyltransferase [Halotalea alkalilenta]
MLVSIQALRAFAAWLVVFHHFMQVFFNFKAESLTGQLLSTRGQVGVDIFFVISGFVIYLASAGKSIHSPRFMLERLIRIAPAYWIFTLITASIIYFDARMMPNYGLDPVALLKSLLFIPTQNPAGFGFYPILPVGWTLNFEMMFYALFALSLLAGRRHRVWITTLLVVLLGGWLAHQPFISSFYTNPVIYEFLLGIGLALIYRRGWLPALSGWALLVPAAIAAGAVAMILQFDDQHPYRLLTWGLPSAALVAALISMEKLFDGNRVLKHLGDWSYSVYLLHVIVLWCGAYLLHRRLGLDPYLTLALCLPVIAVGSWLSFTYVEMALSRRLKRSLGLSRRPPRAEERLEPNT